MKLIRVIDRGLTTLVTVLLVLSFAIMLALAVVQVLLREIVHTNILWGDMAARQLVIWVGFFGASMAGRAGRHFHVGFLSRFLDARVRSWLSVVSDLFAAVVCGYLVAAAWTFVTVGLDPHAVLFLGIRQSAAAMIVPAGFLLMSLQFILKTIQGVAKSASHGSAEDQE
jgi:TRAP-type C4-dicarboxylate transport system permease small subunit